MVEARKSSPESTQDAMHGLLNLSRILSASFLERELTSSRWEFTQTLDRSRAIRLANASEGASA